MKRMLLMAATTSVIALAAPTVASATHHSRGACHHRTHRACEHVHRARHAKVIVFGTAPTITGAPATGLTSSTPAGPDETAGSVASFTGAVLTIRLTDGSTVSGKVTEETEIHCMGTAPVEGGHDGEGGEDSGDDSHGGPRTGAHAADNSQGGSDDGRDGEHGGESNSCTSAVLTPGAVVREAELSVSSGGAVWDHVDVIQ